VKTDRKLTILLHRGHFDPKISDRRGHPPPIVFARLVTPYNFVADSFHTKKLCGRLSSSEVQF